MAGSSINCFPQPASLVHERKLTQSLHYYLFGSCGSSKQCQLTVDTAIRMIACTPAAATKVLQLRIVCCSSASHRWSLMPAAVSHIPQQICTCTLPVT